MSDCDICIINPSVHAFWELYIEFRISIELVSGGELDSQDCDLSLSCSRASIQSGFHLSGDQHIGYDTCSSKYSLSISLIQKTNGREAGVDRFHFSWIIEILEL